MPLVRDGAVDEWVQSVGRRLVRGIPPEYQQKEFNYTFEVVNQKEINAFALPGGPMFLNRGMIEAAKSEAEVAGVMGARNRPRRAAPRHRPGHQGAEVPARRAPRAGGRRGRGRNRRAR